jgi:hypothetical protein
VGTDEDRALFVAGLEAAVADAYRLALEQQAVPAELADTVLVLAQHHDEHCTALAAIGLTARADIVRNERLYGELAETVTGPDPRRAVLEVEESLAATHLESLGVLEASLAAASVASIVPVEAQHAVVLDPTALPPVQTTRLAYTEAAYG